MLHLSYSITWLSPSHDSYLVLCSNKGKEKEKQVLPQILAITLCLGELLYEPVYLKKNNGKPLLLSLHHLCADSQENDAVQGLENLFYMWGIGFNSRRFFLDPLFCYDIFVVSNVSLENW